MVRHRFHGGLRLAGHATAPAGGLQACPPPPRLRVSLMQHAGPAAEPVVSEGERVRRGQRLGEARDPRAVPVHSPVHGRVLGLAEEDLPYWPGQRALHVLIEPLPDGDALLLAPLDPGSADPARLRGRIAEAGLAGLGGAGFPTAEKLSVARRLLVLNGAECEPGISCDDALLRAHADEVVLGGRVLARATGAPRIVCALEEDMPEAIRACRDAIAAHGAGLVELAVLPARYPQGGERQLILALTGEEVPRGGLPRDIGVLVHNVATARAAWRAVAHGEPLLERVVTVAGPGVARPGNFLVPLGTPVSYLVEQAGGYTPAAARLLLGGPMMGVALAHDDVPLGKTHQSVLVLDAGARSAGAPEMPCIRCGDCADACPSRLLPQLLLRQVRAGQFDAARDQGLPDCIECGCCDLACPSRIPLTAHFRHGRAELRRQAESAQAAEAARQRHLARGERLQREADEREQRHAARAAATGADAVAAAIARAKARRDGGSPG